MEEDIYNTIDDFLQYIIEHPGDCLAQRIDINSNIVREVIKIIKDFELTSWTGGDLTIHSTLYITRNGNAILKYGGIGKYLVDKASETIEKNKLELKKLKIDVQNSERIYDTYWWTFGMSVIALLISLILLWLKLTEPKELKTVNKQLPVKHVNVKK